jgi:hypothetical protein
VSKRIQGENEHRQQPRDSYVTSIITWRNKTAVNDHLQWKNGFVCAILIVRVEHNRVPIVDRLHRACVQKHRSLWWKREDRYYYTEKDFSCQWYRQSNPVIFEETERERERENDSRWDPSSVEERIWQCQSFNH